MDEEERHSQQRRNRAQRKLGWRRDSARSKIGGYLNAAANVDSELSSTGLVRKSELSQVQDADLAQAITELTMNQQQLQATMAVGARLSQLTILDYLK